MERLRALSIDGPVAPDAPAPTRVEQTIPLDSLNEYLRVNGVMPPDNRGSLWFELNGKRHRFIMYYGFAPIVRGNVRPTLQGRDVWEFGIHRLVGPFEDLELLTGGSSDIPPTVRMHLEEGAVTIDMEQVSLRSCGVMVTAGYHNGIAIAMVENLEFMAVGSN